MKKYLTDPIAYLVLSLVFFIITLFDTWGNGAIYFSDMTWWAKSSIIGFTLIFGALIIRFMFAPIIYAIYNGIKKLFGK